MSQQPMIYYMKNWKNYALAILVILVLVGTGFDIANLVGDEKELALEDFGLTLEDLKGEQGWAGPAGAPGAPGADGSDGADGESVDPEELIDEVLDELEDREAIRRGEYDLSGVAGNYREDVDLEEGDYEIELRHFGSEDFKVSLVDEDGDITVLVDTDGHFSDTVDFTVAEDEEFELRVSADGDWSVEFEQD